MLIGNHFLFVSTTSEQSKCISNPGFKFLGQYRLWHNGRINDEMEITRESATRKTRPILTGKPVMQKSICEEQKLKKTSNLLQQQQQQ